VIELAALLFAKRVKLGLLQHPVQLLIKRVSRRLGLLAGVEQIFLLLSGCRGSHCHA
jgi:hypothetical protein